MLFPCLTIFMIFIIALAIRYRQINKKQAELRDGFWEREARANEAPAVDLDSLQYIQIPLERFPLGAFSDADIAKKEARLRELSGKRILNLTGKTNTELKERYGVSNLTAVQEYGDNFDELTVLLKEYGEILMARECITDAVSVFEFAASLGTDVSQNYILLGQCYEILGQYDKISYLMDQVSSMSLMLGQSILRHLQEILDRHGVTEQKDPEDFSL